MSKFRKIFSLKPKTKDENLDPVKGVGNQEPGTDKGSRKGSKPGQGNKTSRKKIIASNKNAASILKQNGFDLKSKSANNEEALYWACANGEGEAVRLLLQLGTSPGVYYGYKSPLHAAAEYGVCQIVEDLLDRGAHIMARLPFSDTALHSATRKGRFEMVKFLLVKGADIQARTNYGLTALHIAARCGFETIVKMLLDYGANLEATDDTVRTPLHYAASNDKYEMVMQLVALGANSEARDKKGLAPIHLAGEAGHARTFEILQKEAKKVKEQKQQQRNEPRSVTEGEKHTETRKKLESVRKRHEGSSSKSQEHDERNAKSAAKYRQESRILGTYPDKDTGNVEDKQTKNRQSPTPAIEPLERSSSSQVPDGVISGTSTKCIPESRILGTHQVQDTRSPEPKASDKTTADRKLAPPLETKYERDTGYIHPMILRWD